MTRDNMKLIQEAEKEEAEEKKRLEAYYKSFGLEKGKKVVIKERETEQ